MRGGQRLAYLREPLTAHWRSRHLRNLRNCSDDFPTSHPPLPVFGVVGQMSAHEITAGSGSSHGTDPKAQTRRRRQPASSHTLLLRARTGADRARRQGAVALSQVTGKATLGSLGEPGVRIWTQISGPPRPVDARHRGLEFCSASAARWIRCVHPVTGDSCSSRSSAAEVVASPRGLCPPRSVDVTVFTTSCVGGQGPAGLIPRPSAGQVAVQSRAFGELPYPIKGVSSVLGSSRHSEPTSRSALPSRTAQRGTQGAALRLGGPGPLQALSTGSPLRIRGRRADDSKRGPVGDTAAFASGAGGGHERGWGAVPAATSAGSRAPGETRPPPTAGPGPSAPRRLPRFPAAAEEQRRRGSAGLGVGPASRRAGSGLARAPHPQAAPWAARWAPTPGERARGAPR
ncbi:PREDICTED: translation initiation factor IF-2-like, partial [Chinchilla lanigera]|uniref:translation initiation factor IF-2-like n=1 Tax=Chinchilla lanigera TaxID=34839 RepID=UPI00069915DB